MRHVCVCVCRQHCDGESESEKQTGQQRDVPGSPCFPFTWNLKEPSTVSGLCARLSVRVCGSRMRCAWSFKCVTSQCSSSGPILRPATHGVARPPQTHWANDRPWQLKLICESVWHQEGHLLPAL